MNKELYPYRVWLRGSSMTATYDGYVDVDATDEEGASFRAKRKLTGPGGAFSDWGPSMFKTEKVEKRYG